MRMILADNDTTVKDAIEKLASKTSGLSVDDIHGLREIRLDKESNIVYERTLVEDDCLYRFVTHCPDGALQSVFLVVPTGVNTYMEEDYNAIMNFKQNMVASPKFKRRTPRMSMRRRSSQGQLRKQSSTTFSGYKNLDENSMMVCYKEREGAGLVIGHKRDVLDFVQRTVLEATNDMTTEKIISKIVKAFRVEGRTDLEFRLHELTLQHTKIVYDRLLEDGECPTLFRPPMGDGLVEGMGGMSSCYLLTSTPLKGDDSLFDPQIAPTGIGEAGGGEEFMTPEEAAAEITDRLIPTGTEYMDEPAYVAACKATGDACEYSGYHDLGSILSVTKFLPYACY